MEMLQMLEWRNVNDQEMLPMQVHSRQALIAVMLDPLSQEQWPAPHDLSRPLS